MAKSNRDVTKGPGDLWIPPDDDEPSVLDCPNETGTWLAENLEEKILTAAIEALGDYMTGGQDSYAERKLLREMIALANECTTAIYADEDDDRRSTP